MTDTIISGNSTLIPQKPDFQFVPENCVKPYREKLLEFIKAVHEEVRNELTFQHYIIGSSIENMVTRDYSRPSRFDFDIDFEINNKSASDAGFIIENALKKLAGRYGLKYVRRSKRVFTLEFMMRIGGGYDPNEKFRIITELPTSCDIAVVCEADGKPQTLIYDKKTGHYRLEVKKQSDKELEKKADKIRKYGNWDEVRWVYLDKKNNNSGKKSRSLYAQTVKECYERQFKQEGKK